MNISYCLQFRFVDTHPVVKLPVFEADIPCCHVNPINRALSRLFRIEP